MAAGRGISAVVNSQNVIAGNLKMLEEKGIAVENMEEVNQYIEKGSLITYVAIDNKYRGYIVLADTVREESKNTIKNISALNIKPVLLTGDNEKTAKTIAESLNIKNVKANCLPEDKMEYIENCQKNKVPVCMIGDGINDAPALKQADIGVAMGITGSEVAKDAASMVLTDDNFATIVKAIENGRNLYRNIQRAIQFLLSGNTAGILAVLYASFLALPVPFKAVHLLFINLLTDSLPAIALGVEPHSSDVMNEKPRPKNQSILTKKVLTNICAEGIVIGVMTMIAFYVGFLRNAEVASTMAFSTLCLSRLVHGFNCKSDKPVWFTKKMWNNKSMIGAFFVGFVLLNAVLLVPALQGIFAVAPLTIAELLTVYGLSLGTFVIVQILKMIRK